MQLVSKGKSSQRHTTRLQSPSAHQLPIFDSSVVVCGWCSHQLHTDETIRGQKADHQQRKCILQASVVMHALSRVVGIVLLLHNSLVQREHIEEK
jgi:hypothetical protein